VPGFRPLVSPISLFGGLLPRIPSLNPGITWQWDERKTAYFNHSYDVISFVPLLIGGPCVYTCSLDVMRQVLGNEIKAGLAKPPDMTMDKLWGPSVASGGGDLWKRHRRIVGPAFNTKTYQLVRETTQELYQEMIEREGWINKPEVTIALLNQHMIKFSLLTLARCAFGMPVSWASVDTSEGEDMSFTEAITVAAETIIANLMLPDWMFKLPFKPLQNIDRAWNTFYDFVNAHIRSISEDINKQKDNDENDSRNADVLRRLIASSESDGKYRLSEREVVLLMKYLSIETTANGMIATLSYLAIHQDEQENAYMDVKGRLGPNGELDIPNSNALPYLRACFLEGVRLFTGPLVIPRTLAEDFPIKVERPSPHVVVLPKGSRVIVDLINTLRNPNDFENPEQYKPSRWLRASELDLPMFGTGPRACIGRKLALTEAVLLLALFLRDWVLDIDLAPGETRSEYEKRVMKVGSFAGTILPIDSVSLKIRRR
ncbi:Leukotriene-B4 omega-hydroxylase 3, partial [Leucoagaricus sp. SymC.cos]